MLRTLSCTVALALVSPALAGPTGSHKVGDAEVSIKRFNKTSPIQVYFPTDYSTGGPYPVVSFSHGKQEGAPDADGEPLRFAGLAAEIASHGAIVLVPLQCLAPKCAKAFFDQLAALGACRRHPNAHPAFKHADFSSVALVGHGLGGQHTERSARKIGFKIKAAVSLHSLSKLPWAKQALVPTLYLAGTRDTVAPPELIRKAFLANPQPHSRYANLVGAGHLQPGADSRLDSFIAHFVRCHTVNDEAACTALKSMCASFNFEACLVKAPSKLMQDVEETQLKKVQKSCPVCLLYFLVVLIFLFGCFFPSCVNERFYGK